MMREVLRGCVSFVWLILLPALAFAQTEVRVFVGGAMTEPVKEAGAAFARSSGNTLVYVSDTTGALQKGWPPARRPTSLLSPVQPWIRCKRKTGWWRGAGSISRAH